MRGIRIGSRGLFRWCGESLVVDYQVVVVVELMLFVFVLGIQILGTGLVTSFWRLSFCE